MISDEANLNQAVGKLEGLVSSLEKDMENYREDKKEVYRRLNAVEHKLESLPSEEEWSCIKAMAKAQADRGKFWADMRKAMAKRGLIAAGVIFIVYFWEGLAIALKHKLGG